MIESGDNEANENEEIRSPEAQSQESVNEENKGETNTAQDEAPQNENQELAENVTSPKSSFDKEEADEPKKTEAEAGNDSEESESEQQANDSDEEVIVRKKKFNLFKDVADESKKTEAGDESEESESEQQAKDSDEEVIVRKKKFSLFKGLNDSDFSDNEEESSPIKAPSENQKSDSELHGNNSDDEEDIRKKKLQMLEQFHSSNSNDEALNREEKPAREKKERKKKKKSKPEEDEKLKIYSETQRLMREKEISLPYHKPRQRTLKEFLNRKKKSIVNVDLTSAKKMQGMWKEIEESTQSVSQFFKSDSEGDTEDSKKPEVQLETRCEESKISESNEAQDFGDVNESSVERIKKNLNFEDESVDNKIMEVENTETNMEENKLLSPVIEPMEESTVPSVEPMEESKDDTNSNFSHTKDSNSWMKNILEFEKQEKSNVKKNLLRKINPKLLNFTPKLSIDSDLFIDLNNGKDSNLHDGAKKLLDRFVKNCVIHKRQTIKKDIDLTVSKEERNDKGDICNVVTEKVTYKMTEEIVQDVVEDEKPGAKLQRLKIDLQTKMAEKWEEEYKRKMEVEKEYTTAKKKEEELEEEWEEEEIEDEESEEGESEPEENDIELVDKEKKKSKYVDFEAEESGEEAGDELDEDDDEEDDKEQDNDDKEDEKEDEKEGYEDEDEDGYLESLIPAYQPGGGFLNGGSTLTQPEGKKDGLLSPSFPLSGMTCLKDLTPSTQTSDTNLNFTRSQAPDVDTHRRKLFDDSVGNDKFDLTDAFDFCSGRFPGATQNVDLSQASDKIDGLSQLVMGESQEPNVDDLISGKFDATQQKFFSSVDDELGEGWLDTAKTEKSVKKRITVLEDDEDSTKEPETIETESNTEPEISTAKILVSDDENDNAMDGLLIFNKKNKKNLHFSDDEDDVDNNSEGDDNNIDSEKAEGSELEEEEPEGEVDYDSEENEIVRPTDFIEKEAELSESEWSGDEDEKNLDFLDVEVGDQDQLDNDQVRSELEKIHMRRVLDDDKREVRLLQELFFEDGDLHSDGKGRDRKFRWKNIGAFDDDDVRKAESGGESQDEDGDGEQEEQLRKMRHERAVFLLEMKKKGELKSDDENDDDENSLLNLGKSVLEKCTKTVMAVNNKIVDEDSLSKKPFSLMNKRGSFLSRNEQFLSRLAKFTSGSDNINGPKNSKNFVFTTKSPEKPDPKRKLQDCNEIVRKPKRKKIDATDFRPSLLDQLA